MKEGSIFNYTRLTNCTCKFRRLATLYFVARQVGHKRGNTCNRGFNLQCNNVARQIEEKCCPYYRTLNLLFCGVLVAVAVVVCLRSLILNRQMRFSLPSIKCSAAPPSFRLCCLNCAQRFDLLTARSAVVGSWEEPSNI